MEQTDDIIDIDPNLRIALLLAFIKDQLHTKMQVDCLDIVDIFLIGVACTAHIADEVTCLNDIPLL